jgi:hypothetical protein
VGDAGEGLIDADSRIQERMDELARARAERERVEPADPAASRAIESLKLARADLQQQLNATVHERRREAISQALADVDSKLAELQPRRS